MKLYKLKEFFKKRIFNIVCSAAAIILMWLVWIVAYFAVANDLLIPSFGDTVISFFGLLTDTTFWTGFAFTLLRTAEAFLISFALAVALAVISVCGKAAAAFVAPFMVLLRTLPTLAVILILLVWTNPKVAPVIVTVLVIFPAVYSQIMAAVGGIDGDVKEMLMIYRVKKSVRIFKVYLPLVSPNVLAQSGANVSLSLKIMVSAEVLASTFRSLGGLMQNARNYVDMPRLAALTVAAVLTGLLLEIVLSLPVRLTNRWSVKEGTVD